MKALQTAASGMAAQQVRLDNIANNPANVSTTGFKRGREDFQDLFYQELTSGGQGISSARVEVGSGVRLVGLEKEHTNGQLTETGNQLDVAIQGRGMFALETIEGDRVYTRDGSFRKDADGTLISSGGLKVAGDINIPSDAQYVVVTGDGTVQALMPGDTEYTTVGQLEVAGFTNASGLRPLGNNLFEETPESGEALPINGEPDVQLVNGFLEGSNVDVATELIAMILAQRAYELNSKAISTAEQMMGTAVNLKR